MPLNALTCSASRVDSFDPIRNMPLKNLHADYWLDPTMLVALPQLKYLNGLSTEPYVDYARRWQVWSKQHPRAGLRAEFFADDRWEQKVGERIEPWLGWRYANRSPWPDLSPYLYSVRWMGYLTAPQPGSYQLQIEADDDASLWLDERAIFSKQGQRTATVTLTGQPQALRVDFRQMHGGSHVFLSWTLPGGRFEIIPPEAFTHGPAK